MNITAIIALLTQIEPLLVKAIPALLEGAQLLKTAVPASSVTDLVTKGETLLTHMGPFGEAIDAFIQAIEAHKAAAPPAA